MSDWISWPVLSVVLWTFAWFFSNRDVVGPWVFGDGVPEGKSLARFMFLWIGGFGLLNLGIWSVVSILSTGASKFEVGLLIAAALAALGWILVFVFSDGDGSEVPGDADDREVS